MLCLATVSTRAFRAFKYPAPAEFDVLASRSTRALRACNCPAACRVWSLVIASIAGVMAPKCLEFGDIFQQELDGIQLHSILQHLAFGYSFHNCFNNSVVGLHLTISSMRSWTFDSSSTRAFFRASNCPAASTVWVVSVASTRAWMASTAQQPAIVTFVPTLSFGTVSTRAPCTF